MSNDIGEDFRKSIPTDVLILAVAAFAAFWIKRHIPEVAPERMMMVWIAIFGVAMMTALCTVLRLLLAAGSFAVVLYRRWR